MAGARLVGVVGAAEALERVLAERLEHRYRPSSVLDGAGSSRRGSGSAPRSASQTSDRRRRRAQPPWKTASRANSAADATSSRSKLQSMAARRVRWRRQVRRAARRTASSSRRGNSASIVRGESSAARERPRARSRAAARSRRGRAVATTEKAGEAASDRPRAGDEEGDARRRRGAEGRRGRARRRGGAGDGWSRAAAGRGAAASSSPSVGSGVEHCSKLSTDRSSARSRTCSSHRVGGRRVPLARRAPARSRDAPAPRSTHTGASADELDTVDELGRELVRGLDRDARLTGSAWTGQRDEAGLPRSRAATSSTSWRRPTRAVAGAGSCRRACSCVRLDVERRIVPKDRSSELAQLRQPGSSPSSSLSVVRASGNAPSASA